MSDIAKIPMKEITPHSIMAEMTQLLHSGKIRTLVIVAVDDDHSHYRSSGNIHDICTAAVLVNAKAQAMLMGQVVG